MKTAQVNFSMSLVAVLGLVTAACGTQPAKRSPSTSPDTSGTVATTGGGAAAPKAPAAPASTNVNTISGTISLALASLKDSGGDKSFALGDGPISGDGDTAQCTAHGEPVSADPAKNVILNDGAPHMSGSDADYAAGKAYCVLNHDSADPESIKGLIDMGSLFACMMGDVGAHFGKGPVALDLASPALLACFSGGTPDALGLSKVTVQSDMPAAFGGQDWDFSTVFVLTVSGTDFTLKNIWKDSNGVQAMAALMPRMGQPDPTGKGFDGYVIAFDQNDGGIRADAKLQRLYNQGFARTMRALIKGAIGADGHSFTTVDAYSLIRTDLYNSAGGNGQGVVADPAAITSGGILTYAGNTAHGYRAERLQCSTSPGHDCSGYDVGLWTVNQDTDLKVYGGNGQGVTALKPIVNQDLDVLLNPSFPNYISVADWFAALKVPTYDHIDFKAVNE